MDHPLLERKGVSSKLLIVVMVQSALVLGLGGVALGVSMGGSAKKASHGQKKKPSAPPAHQEDEALAEADDAHQPSHPPTPEQPPPVVAGAHDARAEEGPAEQPPDPAHDTRDEPRSPAASPTKPSPSSAEGHPVDAAGTDELAPIAALPREPLEAFALLDEGNARWVQGVTKSRDLVALRAQLETRKASWATIVTCSDGRVVPELVFDTGPGPLSTVKTPALKADPALASGVELALRKFEPKVLIVLSHQGCDDGTGRPLDAQVTDVTHRLLSRKPIGERTKTGKLLVLRALYAMDTGRVRWLDSDEGNREESAHR